MESRIKSSKGLVSAVIPTYNRGYVVSKAIDSILGQTYSNIEIIVVDDGSTDDTCQVLAKYGDKIRVVCQQNSGPASARNRGIVASRGEIITFLDSDDVWLPTKVQRQVSLLERAPASVPCCLCNGITRTPWGETWNAFEMGLFHPGCDEGLWLNVPELLATRFILFCQLVAIRRGALEKVGYFDASYRFMEDYDLSLRLAVEGPWLFIREPLATMNINPVDSLSLKVSNEQVHRAEYMLRTRERLLASLLTANETPRSLGYLKRAIKRARRELWRAQLCESNYLIQRIAGRIVKGAERCYMAIFRRSPWFPRAKAARVDRGATIPASAFVELITAKQASSQSGC